MEHNNTPDSWDQEIEGGSGDRPPVSQVTDAMTVLNVNAAPFVPGQNVYAREFVPSFMVNSHEESDTADKLPPPDSDPPPEINNERVDQAMDTDQTPEEPLNTMEEDDTPADWSANADSNGGTPGTPDSGGGGTEDDDQEVNLAAAMRKKRISETESCEDTVRKDHLNIVFIGHVDAGKSTIGGHIMYLTGMVEKRTLEKYEREAKEKNRETWYLSWALDTNLEERDKGKTVEVGRAYFETNNKHFTILDAPGHKSFVPNMIGGASQADVAVLVISARKGEFETGFERGGQTREHAMLVKTAGVKKLVVVVNKMDDPTVQWNEERYSEIKEKLTPYIKKCGFNPKTDIYYLPVSGLTGINLKETNRELCPWYTGPSLIEYLDDLPPINRMDDGPVRLPIVDRYRDMGTIILGKVESGVLLKGQFLTLMPNKLLVEIMQLWSDDDDTDQAYPGENVKVKLKNVEEEDALPGFVLCSSDNLCHTAKVFDAQIVILEHKSIICAGYSAVMHIHTSAEEVTIKALLCLVDKKSGDKSKTRPRFIKQDQIAIVRMDVPGGSVCMEAFKEFPQMGRFTLRDEGKTIAIGKVLKVVA